VDRLGYGPELGYYVRCSTGEAEWRSSGDDHAFQQDVLADTRAAIQRLRGEPTG
jgi:hypothetical protein